LENQLAEAAVVATKTQQELQDALDNAEDGITQADVDAAIKGGEDTAQALQTSLDNVNNDLTNANNMVTTLNSVIVSLQSQLSVAREEITSRTQMLQALQQEFQNAQIAADEVEDNLQSQLQNAAAEISAAAGQLSDRDETIQDLLEQIERLKSGYGIPSTQSCFRKGTLVKTDQGTMEIQNVVAGYHTINNKQIKCVTLVYNSDGMVVKIEKDCLGENKPSNTIYMQKDHKLMISPFEFSALLTSGKIHFEKSNTDEILYNILLDSHETMMIENIEVETLNPELEISKYFMGDRSEEHKALIESNTPKMVFC